jgi:hypothetical protein
MPLNAADIANKQIRRAIQAVSDYEAGVKNPDRDPIAAAIKSDARRKNELAKAEAEGRWLKAMQSKTLQDWQGPTLAKGVQRYQQGVETSGPHTGAFWQEHAPKLEAIKSTISAMPNATEQDRIARMVKNLELMKKTKRT